MHSNRIKGLTNALVITFAVLLLALQISIFVSNFQLKKSFRWFFKKVIALKAEKV